MKAFMCRGMAHMELGKFRDAQANFTQVLNLKKDCFIALILRGMTYQLLERPKDALLDFTQALEKTQNNTDTVLALEKRGKLYRLMGQYENARTDFTQALTVPLDDDSWRRQIREALEKLDRRGR